MSASDKKVGRNAAPFTLDEVLRATGGTPLSTQDVSTQCVGVSTDTRDVQRGELFVAMRGENFDAHDYLRDAFDKGASAAIIERDINNQYSAPLIRVDDSRMALSQLARFHRLRFNIPVVGVTGSYGKTTTRAMIATALSTQKNVLTSRENFNNEIGVPMTLLQLDETHRAAVLEMGMRGLGQIKHLAHSAAPTIGVITNIGPQHLELLGSIENIAAAKSELLDALDENGVAVLPAPSSDEYSQLLHARLSAKNALTFGASADADFRVLSAQNVEGGVQCEIAARGETVKFLLPMPGAHNAKNAACALAVASVCGVPLEEAARALETLEVPGARMRVLEIGGLTIIDDCYNAGPSSMKAALQTLHDFPRAGRRMAVLGAMKEIGATSEEEHRKIGILAVQAVGKEGVVMGVGDETRVLIDEALDANDDGLFAWFADAEEAAASLSEYVEQGDVILVKGSRSVGLEKAVSALANSSS